MFCFFKERIESGYARTKRREHLGQVALVDEAVAVRVDKRECLRGVRPGLKESGRNGWLISNLLELLDLALGEHGEDVGRASLRARLLFGLAECLRAIRRAAAS